MSLKAGRVGVSPDQVNQQGKVKGVNIPIATPDKAGLVKPVSKTAGMTQGVGVDENGKLFTAAGSKVTITKILNETVVAANTDYSLLAGLSEFDLIILECSVAYSGSPQMISCVHVASLCTSNKLLVVHNEASGGGFNIKNDTTVTGIAGTFSNAATYSIYGIKF